VKCSANDINGFVIINLESIIVPNNTIKVDEYYEYEIEEIKEGGMGVKGGAKSRRMAAENRGTQGVLTL
jgi:hypothetical protein